MQYKTLGNTGLLVSEICLGTMTFAGDDPSDLSENGGIWKAIGNVGQAAADALIKASIEAGVNFIDTADVYSEGKSETTIGKAIKNLNIARHDVVLATKVYGRTGPGRNEVGASRGHIMDAVEASLRRLQTDHIDLYQMHHVDRTAPWDEVWQAMDTLVQQGKIIYVGSSNFAGWHITQANEAASRRHSLGLVSEQSHYNLLVRTIELEVLPACRHYGLGVIPWSPLSGGLLGGGLNDADTARRRSPQALRRMEKLRPRLEQWEALCADVGEAPAAVALAWLLAQDGVTCPILGPRTMEQLEGASLRALDITLGHDTLSAIDKIFPGPGGTAPEAYSW